MNDSGVIWEEGLLHIQDRDTWFLFGHIYISRDMASGKLDSLCPSKRFRNSISSLVKGEFISYTKTQLMKHIGLNLCY